MKMIRKREAKTLMAKPKIKRGAPLMTVPRPATIGLAAPPVAIIAAIAAIIITREVTITPIPIPVPVRKVPIEERPRPITLPIVLIRSEL